MRRPLALLLLGCSVATADIVVLRDGSVLEGAAKRTGNRITVGAREVAIKEVVYWEGADKLPRHAPTPGDHIRGCAMITNKEVISLCAKRLERAVASKDHATARKLLQRAEKAGLPAERAGTWTTRIAALGEGGGSSGVKVPGYELLVARLLDRSKTLIETDKLRALHLLRAALRLDPKNETGTDMLADEAPRLWRLGDKRNWLDWYLEVLYRVRKLPNRRSADLDRARGQWGRKDLVGLETRNMILITPLPNPMPIGMCIELGDLTCEALDAMFQVETPKRDEFLPLIVYFYENKGEYIRLGRGKPSAKLALTAGFYVPSENVSRFFWPSHPGAQAGVRDTFVHELTHHWIERRNPRWHERDLASIGDRTKIPGYWVVEGFATFIQHSRFDRQKRTWTYFNPKAHSLEVVAAMAKAQKLLDWNMVYTLTQAKFHGDLTKTARKAHATVKGRWMIQPRPISSIRLFYEQSSATCMFLYWGEKGRYRDKLLDYVTAFYTTQKMGSTKLEEAFGLTQAELGKKVAAFATRVVEQGYRPDRKKN